jgi:hypothetical protein
LRFIKKENPDLHARLEAKIKSKTSEARRCIADADPSELDDWPDDKWFGLSMMEFQKRIGPTSILLSNVAKSSSLMTSGQMNTLSK